MAEPIDIEEARIISWLITGLRHEAMRLIKKHRRLREKELLILNEPVRKRVEDTLIGEKMETLVANSDTLAEAEERIFLMEALSILTPLQKKVIIGTILAGSPEREIAQKIGITHQAVNKLKKRGLNRLRKSFIQMSHTGK